MKVAYLSPLPPERSGIADYSALLLPALLRKIDVAVVRRSSRRSPRGIDVWLYHVGNDADAHGWIVEALRRRPGIVVLHDFVLHHLVAGLTLGRHDGQAYLGAMEREGGIAGRLLAHGVIENRIPPLWETRPQDFPLAREVLDHATGLIVHSRHVEERARGAGYAGPIRHIPHPAWPAPGVESAPVPGGPVIGCFGNVNPSKRVPQLLEAFARLRRRHPEARLLLVGAAAPRFRLDDRLERLGLADGDAVHREDYVSEERLWSLMAACDVCVSLRWPTMGETSGSALRALSLGRPLVVSDVGWFSELPDDVALKVPVDAHEVELLTGALDLLASSEPMRAAMTRAARDYIAREHRLERVADAYAETLELAAGGDRVRDAVLWEVARAAGETGIGPDDPEALALARALREVGVGA
ncbi:MAG: glycosyltransferase family 4 protein [Actinobacteria bacterium]|nr:glycosyltransferase family 4 protein [Actinomycetota bacterium]